MLRPDFGLISSVFSVEIAFRLGLAVMASVLAGEGVAVSDIAESDADTREREADTGESDADTGERVADTGESVADTGERVADIGESDADTGERVADMGESVADTGGRVAEDETVFLILLRGFSFSFENSGANRASSSSGDASNWQVALAVRLFSSPGCGVSPADCDWQNDLIKFSADINAI